MLTKKNLYTGFAIFSMFFGSGNLVFPLLLGQETKDHFWVACVGCCFTGVLMPLAGALSMLLCQGNLAHFFHHFGKKSAFYFSMIALGLLGPFGVIARCFTVTHGALEMLFPALPLVATSLFLCILIFFLSINPTKIVPILGTFLTPFLLIA